MNKQDGFEPTPEQEARIERRVDLEGISYAFARAIELGEVLEGMEVEGSEVMEPPHPTPGLKRTRQRRRRQSGHVRDFESDRDHQLAEERAAYQPPSEEQRQANARGRALVEATLDEELGKDRKIKAIQEQVEREIPLDPDNVAKSEADRERLLNARLRTYFASKAASENEK